jgi:hypothetical protein
MTGHVVHVDLIPFTEICLGGVQHHMLICDEFSTYLYSIPMKTKSNSDIITAFTTLIAYFKQFGYSYPSFRPRKLTHECHGLPQSTGY